MPFLECFVVDDDICSFFLLPLPLLYIIIFSEISLCVCVWVYVCVMLLLVLLMPLYLRCYSWNMFSFRITSHLPPRTKPFSLVTIIFATLTHFLHPPPPPLLPYKQFIPNHLWPLGHIKRMLLYLIFRIVLSLCCKMYDNRKKLIDASADIASRFSNANVAFLYVHWE